MKKLLISAVNVLTFCLFSVSHAAIIEGTFTGTVGGSNRDDTNFYGNGFGGGALTGLAVTGTFRYDTELAGNDLYPNNDTYGTTGRYSGVSPDWLDMSFTLLGKTEQLHDGTGTGNPMWDSVVLGSDFDRSDSINVIDATQNPASSVFDSFELTAKDGASTVIQVGTGLNRMQYIFTELGYLDFNEYIDDSMIVGDGVTQAFNWNDGPLGNGSASGLYSVNHQIRGYNEAGVWSLLLNEQYSYNFAINSATAQISSVPVPAAAWLFSTGLLGLIGVARRKKA